MMKAEFMTLWDGLTSGTNTRILVMGATNRPNAIDPAIMRRMPKRFQIKLPDQEQRAKILELMLATTQLDDDFSIDILARATEGLSGSDLKETCRNAAMVPVTEVMREKGRSGKAGLEAARLEASRGAMPSGGHADDQGFQVRPLRLSDFKVHNSHAYIQVESSRRIPFGIYDEPLS